MHKSQPPTSKIYLYVSRRSSLAHNSREGKVAVYLNGRRVCGASPSFPFPIILYIQCRARVPFRCWLSFPNDGYGFTTLALGAWVHSYSQPPSPRPRFLSSSSYAGASLTAIVMPCTRHPPQFPYCFTLYLLDRFLHPSFPR
jgi:hypothetical protein